MPPPMPPMPPHVVLSHLDRPEFASVYRPCCGTRLLLDALSSEAAALQAEAPSLCVELGCGFGAVAAHLAHLLPTSAVVALDIMAAAARAAKTTAAKSQLCSRVSSIHGDLLSALRPGSVDLLVFHVPYVPTSTEVLEAALTTADPSVTWAGGPRGLGVLERLLPALPTVLSLRARCYLLFYEACESVGRVRALAGMRAEPCASYESPAERLFVLRCTFDQQSASAGRAAGQETSG